MVNDSKLVKGTANKPDTWGSQEEYESYIRKFKGYSQLTDEAFDAFVSHGIQGRDGITSLFSIKHGKPITIPTLLFNE